MAYEVPVGFAEDGKLITALRFTDAELSDIFMANEMYGASPEAIERRVAQLASLEPGSIKLDVHWDE